MPRIGREPDKVSHLRTFDGPQISTLLTGKRIGEVYKTDRLLVIRCLDGFEIRVAWVTEDGAPVAGRPAISFFGKNIVTSVGPLHQEKLKKGAIGYG